MMYSLDRTLDRTLDRIDPRGGCGPGPGRQVRWLALEAIAPNPNQPRQVFDEGAIAELAESIRQ